MDLHNTLVGVFQWSSAKKINKRVFEQSRVDHPDGVEAVRGRTFSYLSSFLLNACPGLRVFLTFSFIFNVTCSRSWCKEIRAQFLSLYFIDLPFSINWWPICIIVLHATMIILWTDLFWMHGKMFWVIDTFSDFFVIRRYAVRNANDDDYQAKCIMSLLLVYWRNMAWSFFQNSHINHLNIVFRILILICSDVTSESTLFLFV